MRGSWSISMLLFVWLLVATATVLGQSQPPSPFVDRGACPFECCVYRQWNVDKPTLVRSGMSDSSSIAFRLKRGDKVRALTGTVITSRPGIAEARKPISEGRIKLKTGDRIYLLTNQGEGYVKAWSKGRIFSAEALDPAQFKIIRQPASVWWVRVRERGGKTGWTRQPENFGNKDECG